MSNNATQASTTVRTVLIALSVLVIAALFAGLLLTELNTWVLLTPTLAFLLPTQIYLNKTRASR